MAPSVTNMRVGDEVMEQRANVTELKKALESLGKTFFAFENQIKSSQATGVGDGKEEEEARKKFVLLNNEIDNLELQFTKMITASKAHYADKEQYEELRKKSGEEIASVNRHVEEKKLELAEAVKVKDIHNECEKLKDDIVQIPSCSKLGKNIEETQQETELLKKEIKDLDKLNEHRKDLLGALLASVSALERSMEEPQKDLYDDIRVDHTLIDKIQQRAFEALASGDGDGEGKGAEDEEMKDAE